MKYKYIRKWYMSGVEVTEDFYNQNWNKYPVKKALEEKNLQLRMAILQRIGIGRLIKELNCKILGMSPDGQYELLSTKELGSEEAKILKMRCPSTNLIYAVFVDPKCSTWEDALRWYYKGEKYQFVKET